MKELTEAELFNKMAALCARAEHCRSDVAARLARQTLSPDAVERILTRLVEERYIDEARYARFYAHDKLRYNQWGRRKIAQGLWQKRIGKEDISQALDALDETEYRSVITDVLNSKKRSVKGRNDYERRMKLLRYAAGKGFEISLVQSLLHTDDVTDDADELDEDW